jgi:hypothetical protein
MSKENAVKDYLIGFIAGVSGLIAMITIRYLLELELVSQGVSEELLFRACAFVMSLFAGVMTVAAVSCLANYLLPKKALNKGQDRL